MSQLQFFNYIYVINVLLDCAITYNLLIIENTTLMPPLKISATCFKLYFLYTIHDVRQKNHAMMLVLDRMAYML